MDEIEKLVFPLAIWQESDAPGAISEWGWSKTSTLSTGSFIFADVIFQDQPVSLLTVTLSFYRSLIMIKNNALYVHQWHQVITN